MIRGETEIRCNGCSASFFIPSFYIVIASDPLTEVKNIIINEGWLYKNMSECYCQECKKKFE